MSNKQKLLSETPPLNASNYEWAKWEKDNPIHVFGDDSKCKICGEILAENMQILCKR